MREPDSGRDEGTVTTRSPPSVEWLRRVSAAWFGDCEATLEALDADAFSGETIVLARTGAAGDVVLKSLPAEARPRVARVHRFMRFLRAAGRTEIPEVLATPSGDTLVADETGRLWEAVRHVPGASTAAPTLAQARAAAATLAGIHVGAAAWPEEPPRRGVPGAVTRRIDHARRLLADPWWSWKPQAADDATLGGLLAARLAVAADVTRRPENVATLRRIAAVRPVDMRLQMVIRDVWSGHVIFAADDSARVAGVVDLHAAAVDTTATDVARLFGSWSSGADVPLADARAGAIEAYEAVRPLDPRERAVVPWLDATGTVFAIDSWFRWVFFEGRRFERPVRVVERVDRLLGRLAPAFEWLDRLRDAV